MIILTGESANELYVAACCAVRRDGERVSPRGMATTEILDAHLYLIDPRRRFVDLPPARVINPAFAVAEALWILSGSDESWIFQYNRALARYADDGRLQGAYGPRIRRWHGYVDQLDQVRRLLARDPDSRQGVIQLYDPERDTHGHRDVPCTLGYRFFLRGGRLHMHTTMRSQDLWLGFPYDLFTATLMHELLAGWLGVALGEYRHHVDSLHLYAHHDAVAASLPQQPVRSTAMPPVTADWTGLEGLMTGVIAGAPPPNADEVWITFAQVMGSYRAWTGGDRDQARALAAGIRGELGNALRRWYDHRPPAAGNPRTSDHRHLNGHLRRGGTTMTDAADNSVYVKRYTDPHRSAAARTHLNWLRTLNAGLRLPVLRSASAHQLVFEHLGHRQPGADDLSKLADALGRLHAAAHVQHLHPARLDQPFPTTGGMVITDFITPRRNTLRRLPLTVAGLPAAIYKDANIRNFLLIDQAVAIVDFDDLTLAPFGYDLAKLIVTTAMTHGQLDPHDVDAALEIYNARTAEAVGDHTTCPPERLRHYAEFHHLLTARYLHHNGYVHFWPAVRPWPETGDTP